MYRSCLFCHADLGRNQVIEHLTVGRRLAFDTAKGRLWVVCKKCERWNLTPFGDRWEALEECEREFRGTTRRMSTDNVGLARLKDGLELVRIGEPLRPEFAAWRYGDQFGRRRRKHFAVTGLVTVGALGLIFAPTVAGLSIGSTGLWNLASLIRNAVRSRRIISEITSSDGSRIPLTEAQIDSATIADDRGADWALLVPRDRKGATLTRVNMGKFHRFDGEGALVIAAKILPRVNRAGGRTGTVKEAVALVEETPAASELFQRQLNRISRHQTEMKRQTLRGFDPSIRLALEMAVHEDAESRWLAGELLELEEAWRQAEEIADIADKLGTTVEWDEELERQRAEGMGNRE